MSKRGDVVLSSIAVRELAGTFVSLFRNDGGRAVGTPSEYRPQTSARGRSRPHCKHPVPAVSSARWLAGRQPGHCLNDR